MATASVGTYPDTLAHDELAHIFRHMQGTTAVSFLAEKDGPFRLILPLLVKNLRIARRDEVILDFHNSTLIVGVHASVRYARELLRGCGKFIERVYFNKVLGLPWSLNELAELFSEHLKPQISLESTSCHNLELVDLFAAIFKEKGVKFINLNIRIEDDNIMDWLKHPFTADIKVLHFTASDIGALNSEWEIIGQSLEEVNLVIGFCTIRDWKQCIEGMKLHARKLSSISIKDISNDFEESELADFYTSYGEQLLKIELGDMSADTYSRIANNCPNVRVALQNKSNCYAGISVLAKNLHELDLKYSPRDTGLVLGVLAQRLKKGMENCHSLEKLSALNLYHININIIPSIFPIKMEYLKILELSYIVLPESFDHIASVTSRLKSIKLSSHCRIPTSGIEALLFANPGLEDVEISEDPMRTNAHTVRNSTGTAEVVGDLVGALSKCNKLKNISISLRKSKSPSEGELRQIFSPFWMKNIIFRFTLASRMCFFSSKLGSWKLVQN